MKKNRLAIFAIALGIALGSCSSEDNPNAPQENSPRRDIELQSAERSVIAAEKSFAFNLLGEALSAARDDENVVVSPLSVSIALSMAANGTEGQMKREILDALNFKATDDLATMNALVSRLLGELTTLDNQSTFIAKQSVWKLNSIKLQDEFAQLCSGVYDASVSDFASKQQGVAAINSWIEQSTRGMIKNALKEDDMENFALVNATYFQGKWADKFDAKATANGTFTNADGTTTDTPMMKQTNTMPYLASLDAQFVKLFYGNLSFCMTVILPNENSDLRQVIDNIGRSDWSSFKKSFNHADVTLALPRFTAESNGDIKETLETLGIREIWKNEATKMAYPDIKMKKFVHNAKVVVNEEGTEASAASSILGEDVAPGPRPCVEINFNRPFAFIIEETSTGAILFAGAVNSL